MDTSSTRSASAASGDQYMNRTASALSSWGDQSVRAEELDIKLRTALKKNRDRIPDEWFEKQCAGFAARDKAAREACQSRNESRRSSCREFAMNRTRAIEVRSVPSRVV